MKKGIAGRQVEVRRVEHAARRQPQLASSLEPTNRKARRMLRAINKQKKGKGK